MVYIAWGIVHPNVLDRGRLSVVSTPTALWTPLHQICLIQECALLALELQLINFDGMIDVGIYCSLTSWTVVVCLPYAHQHLGPLGSMDSSLSDLSAKVVSGVCVCRFSS